VSKLGIWREPNWYWEQGWQKKEVLELLRRTWKHCKRVKNLRKRGLPA
jgi:hypothetical protein